MSTFFTAQELKERIDNNDNRCTAKPYLLLLQEKNYMYSSDGDYGGEEVFFLKYEEDDPREFSSLDELKDYFRSEYMDQGVKFQYKRLWKREYYDTNNVFLTDKGYEDHLAINKHNLISPKSFGIHAFRNKEIASLFNLIDECLKLQHQLEIQTKRVENLKKSNKFYADKLNWVYSRESGIGGLITVLDTWTDQPKAGGACFYPHFGGKLARSCQAIDLELEKQLEEVK